MEIKIEDTFRVTGVLATQFVGVKRVQVSSTIYNLEIEFDHNVQSFGFQVDFNYEFKIRIARQSEFQNGFSLKVLNDQAFKHYDLVMLGTIFKKRALDSNLVLLQISFGGLYMELKGIEIHFQKFAEEQKIYFMVKKSRE